jgi:hypothetical protein
MWDSSVGIGDDLLFGTAKRSLPSRLNEVLVVEWYSFFVGVTHWLTRSIVAGWGVGIGREN